MSGNIIEKLLGSESLRSLEQERRIAHKLSSLKWDSTHSCHYTDLETKKTREIDVVAVKRWERKTSGRRKHVRLNLVVECKSIKGSHIMFSQEEPPRHGIMANYLWIGQEWGLRTRVAEVFERVLEPNLVGPALRRFHQIAFPQHSVIVKELLIDPPSAEKYASAFRETTSQSDKELENSVLWKAGRALHSAIQSLEEERIGYHLEWMSIVQIGTKKHKNDKELIESCQGQLRQADIYHPVVVLECPLWMWDGHSLSQTDWCRLQQKEYLGLSGWWFDVVTAEGFDRYIQNLDEYYSSSFKAAKAKEVIIRN